MKYLLITCCALSIHLSTSAEAGVNGTYNVKGSETANGKKSAFSGTVVVSNYKAGKYALKFKAGDTAKFSFTFAKPLKDIKTPQTVNCFSSLGTGTATFSVVQGRYNVEFSYKAKSSNVKGSGTGTK